MIFGNGVRLRAIERSDLAAFLRWFNDPDIRRCLDVIYPMSMADEERWFERQLDTEDRVFAIDVLDGEAWHHIGNVGLHRIDWRNRKALMGIVIGERERWGRGHGTEAVRTLARFAFEELNLGRLELETYDFNARAIRCYERCGFQREGLRRRAVFRGGSYHDVIVMGLLADELAPRKLEQAPSGS